MAATAPSVADVIAVLEQLAPPSLAESWDNVGLLAGDRRASADRIMTCLTLTEDVAAEAVAGHCGLIVSHHPVMFRAIQRVTADDPEGRTLLRLLRAGIAVYCPHTAFDSAAEGINRRLAGLLSLTDIAPLRPAGGDDSQAWGGGRFGDLAAAESLGSFVERVRRVLRLPVLSFAGDPLLRVQRIAVACGSAAEMLSVALDRGCHALLTGEARFHACLEARERSMGLVLAGHFATERPAIEALARDLASALPAATVWASAQERDPVQWSLA